MCHLNCYFIKAINHLSCDFHSLLKGQLCPHLLHGPPHLLQLFTSVPPTTVSFIQCLLYAILEGSMYWTDALFPYIDCQALENREMSIIPTSDCSLCSSTPLTFVDRMSSAIAEFITLKHCMLLPFLAAEPNTHRGVSTESKVAGKEISNFVFFWILITTGIILKSSLIGICKDYIFEKLKTFLEKLKIKNVDLPLGNSDIF